MTNKNSKLKGILMVAGTLAVAGIAYGYTTNLHAQVDTLTTQLEEVKQEKDIKIEESNKIIEQLQIEKEDLNNKLYVSQQELEELKAKRAMNTVSRGNIDRNIIDVNYTEQGENFSCTVYNDGGRTADGTPVHWGVVATDPRVIPLGTRMYIEFPSGWEHLSGEYVAHDTGGAVEGNIIDLWTDWSHGQMSQFGRRNVKVTILD